MPRPPKCRRIEFLPDITYFKPAGIPLRTLDEVKISLEEVEAIRLKDCKRLEQEDAAKRMNISRPTFQRLLSSGRRKIADAIMNSKAIRIEGGNFEMASSRFTCQKGHEWNVPFEAMVNTPPHLCPICKTPDIKSLSPERHHRYGCKRGRHREKQGM